MREPDIERLILAMVEGHAPERAAARCGIPLDDAPEHIREARRRLTLAAHYQRDEQLGTAISRLNDCYSRAAEAGEVKTCVSVQKELNRLLDLYRPLTREDEAESPAAIELAAVRAHLTPLDLACEDASTPELARLAVARIVAAPHVA